LMEYLISILSLVVGIAGLAFGIFVANRSKQTKRAILELKPCLSSIFEKNENPKIGISKRKKKKYVDKLSSTIIGIDINEIGDFIFALPYLLSNNSEFPIHNISLLIEYPKCFEFVDNDDTKDFIKIRKSKDLFNRQTSVTRFGIQVRYQVPVLRPGERVVILDPMNFKGDYKQNQSINDSEISYAGLLMALSRIPNFLNLCVCDIIVLSETCSPISKRVKISLFKSKSLEELLSLSSDSVHAYWGGKMPRSGFYFRDPILNIRKKRALYNIEATELVQPNLAVHTKKRGGKIYFWEDITKFEGVVLGLNMPVWNYYQLTGSADVDELIMQSTGFAKA
ncbi:MAG: hypothetical protein WBP16_15965, partial [Ferruginibacter sp.]